MKIIKRLYSYLIVLAMPMVLTLSVETRAEPPAVTIVDEPSLRAATLIGVLRYTQWEDGLRAKMKLCLLGKAESFSYVEAMDGSAIFPETTLDVVRVAGVDHAALDDCQVLLFGSGASLTLPYKKLTQPCLLICNRCGDMREHVAVVLRKENDRIVFDVNLHHAKANGVSFRAAMLELAATLEGHDG